MRECRGVGKEVRECRGVGMMTKGMNRSMSWSGNRSKENGKSVGVCLAVWQEHESVTDR